MVKSNSQANNWPGNKDGITDLPLIRALFNLAQVVSDSSNLRDFPCLECTAVMEYCERLRLTGKQCTSADSDSQSIRKPYQVVDNGNLRYRTEEEVKQICDQAMAHLILNVPRMQLRYKRIDNNKEQRPEWVSISWSMYKVLRVGLTKRGYPIGNKTINRYFNNHISMRALARYVADITKLIQGGGTKGPYLWRQPAPREESDTGYGYVFDEQFDYLVIEEAV